MDTEFAALKVHYDAIIPTLATKADVEALRADIHKWMVASMIGLFIGFGGLTVAMGQILQPQTPAQQTQPPAPIVLYISPPQK
jgi:hypothetical protein